MVNLKKTPPVTTHLPFQDDPLIIIFVLLFVGLSFHAGNNIKLSQNRDFNQLTEQSSVSDCCHLSRQPPAVS